MAITLVSTTSGSVNGTSLNLSWPFLSAGNVAILFIRSSSSAGAGGFSISNFGTGGTAYWQASSQGNANHTLKSFISGSGTAVNTLQPVTGLDGTETGTIAMSWTTSGQLNATLAIFSSSTGFMVFERGSTTNNLSTNPITNNYSSMSQFGSGDYVMTGFQTDVASTLSSISHYDSSGGATFGTQTLYANTNNGVIATVPITSGTATGVLRQDLNRGTTTFAAVTGTAFVVRETDPPTFDSFGMSGFFGI